MVEGGEGFGRRIKEGDMVIVYERHDRMKAVKVCGGAVLQNKFGVFPHADWVGKAYGCKVLSRGRGGYVYLLAPTPQLWTWVLSHRTQIIYTPDISFLLSFLHITPGSIVLESGTGSGSVTTSLARAVAPNGHVYTFDFHHERADSARQDFEKNNLTSLVTVEVRDIQGDGFPDVLAGKVDAVFLDLPQPWLAIPSAAKMLRCNGAICSFSPCIEQVQHTCEILGTEYFTDIRTFEVLLRTYEVRQEILKQLVPGNTSTPLMVPACKRSRPLVSPQQSSGQSYPGAIENLEGSQRSWDIDCTEEDKTGSSLIMARPVPETRGHTGYLTFACHSV